MRTKTFIWRLSFFIISICFTMPQQGWAQVVRKQASFFHSSSLRGSPVTGNRIAVDEEGRVYFQTMRYVWPNNKVIPGCWEGGYLVYSKEGELLGEFWGGINQSHYHDVNVMNDRIYVACSSVGPFVFVFNSEGQVLTRLSIPHSTSVSGAPDKSIWVIDPEGKRVSHYDKFGNYIGFIPSENPQRVRVSPKDGRIYVASAGHGIKVYSGYGEEEGTIPGWPLYNCTPDGNVVAGFAIYTPDGKKVKDIQLQNYNYQTQDVALDAEGNVYIAVKDTLNALGFVSYNSEGEFRFARGADFEVIGVSLPSPVLEAGESCEISINFWSGRSKGYLAASQILQEDKVSLPVFSAFIRDIRGGEWIPVGLAEGEEGKFILTLPEVLSGSAYTLRITSGHEAGVIGSSTLKCDFLAASPASDKLGTITIFSDRNRSVWRSGEEVPFYVAVRSKSSMDNVAFKVELAEIKAVETLVTRLKAGSNTLAFAVPASVTSSLLPGNYTVLCGEANSSEKNFKDGEWTFQLVSSLRPTKFRLTHYPEVIENDLPAQTVVSTVGIIARRGFNHDVRPVYSVASRREDMSLFKPLSPEEKKLGAVLARDPGLPVPEILYQRHRFEKYLEEATRHGIESRIQLLFNEMMVPYRPEMWPEEKRQIQVFTQFASRYPSFAGWSFTGHAHIESFADSDSSAKALEGAREDFAKQYGGDPVQKPLKWFDYYNHFIPDTYEAWDKAALEANPGLSNTASPGEFSSSASGKYPPFIYSPFKMQLAHIQEEQWHEQSIYPFMTDLIRRPGKPLISLNSQWQELGNGQYIGREYFLALSRGLQGVGISQSGLGSPYASVLPHAPYRSLHKIFTVFGDLFFDLKPANDVAILMSYSQEATEGVKGLAWSEQMGRVFQLYTTCLYAHLPVSIIYEEDLAELRNKKPADIVHRVLLITGLKTSLPPEVLKGIKILQANGGIVFKDSDTSSEIEGAQPLRLDFNDLWSLLSRSHTYGNSDSWRVRIDRICRDKAPVLRAMVESVFPLEIDVDNPRCWIGLQRYGKTFYLVVANADMPRIKPDILWHFSSYESTTFPAKPLVRLSGRLKGYEIYDLLGGKKVATERKGDATFFQADLTQCPGRVYVLAAEPIAGVALLSPDEIEFGNCLPLEVHVRTKEGKPFPALVPVELKLTGPEGKPVETIYRAVPPEGLKLKLKTALNWSSGELEVSVCELISGYGARRTINGSSRTPEGIVRELPEVEVYDEPAIQKILASGKNFAILHEDSETELSSSVEALSAVFDTSGKKVAVLDSKTFQSEKKAFDGVIIIWTPTAVNPSLEELGKLNSMPRRLSDNYPGMERAVIQLIYAPWKYGENVLILAGGDVEGLSKAVSRIEFLSGKEKEIERPKSAPEKTEKLLEGEVLTEQRLTDWGRELFGPMIIEAEVSANGEYLALVSQSWGNNLFLLDREGKVLSVNRGGKSFPIPAHQNRLNRYLRVLDSGELYARITDIREPFIFLANYRYGKLIRLYEMMGVRHIGPADSGTMTRTNDCSFAVAPDGRVVAAGNYGVAAFAEDGKELWHEDYWLGYNTLDSLMAKMTAEAAISPDGKFVALIKQRELGSANPEWKPQVVVSMRELSTGKELWSYTFRKGLSHSKVLSTDGKKVILQSDETLMCIDSGKLIWTYEAPIVTGNYYPTVIYQPYMKTVCRDSRYAFMGGKEGSVMLLENGRVRWADRLPEGIFDVEMNKDSSRMAVSSADGFIVCYNSQGERLWERELEVHSALGFMGDILVAADARGIVRYFNPEGELVRSIDLKEYAGKPDMDKEFLRPEEAEVIKPGIVKRKGIPPAAGKPNLAKAASIVVAAQAGWYSTGSVENSAHVLNNGKQDDVEWPWLSLNERYWDASSQRLPQITISFNEPKEVQTVVVKEHTLHPEAVPQEIAIEALMRDGTWETVHVDHSMASTIHSHSFQPLKTTGIRYTVVADLFNNLWTTEIEVY